MESLAVTVRWALRDPKTHRLTVVLANPTPEDVQLLQDRYPDARQILGPMIPGDKVRGAFVGLGNGRVTTWVRDERTEEEQDQDEQLLASTLETITAESTDIPPPGLLAAADAEAFYEIAEGGLVAALDNGNAAEKRQDAWTYRYVVMDAHSVRRWLRGEAVIPPPDQVLTRLEVMNAMREERGLVGISVMALAPFSDLLGDIVDFNTKCHLEDHTDTGEAWDLLFRAYAALGGQAGDLVGFD